MRESGRGRRAGRGSGRPFACHCMHGKKNKIARLIESVYTYTTCACVHCNTMITIIILGINFGIPYMGFLSKIL